MKNIKSKGVPLTSKELQNFWNNYSGLYEKHVEKNFESVHMNLCQLANIYYKKNILELSCGSGNGLRNMLLHMQKRKNIFATDISEKMLKNAQKNLTLKFKTNIYLEKELPKLKEELNSLFQENENVRKKTTINLIQLDNENLDLFNDNSFDAVISSFSLHLVNNPQKMLQESSRVLDNNGIAAFSIWGRPENSPVFTIIPNAMKNLNISFPDMRSNFHISNVSGLKKLVLENGFRSFSYNFGFVPLNIFDFKDFLFMLKTPFYADIIKNIDKEQKDKLISLIEKEFQKIIEQDQHFGTEVILVRCQK